MSSGSGYRIVVPNSVAEQFERLVPYGITTEVWASLDRLAEDPSVGVRVRRDPAGNGPMVFTFKVERMPLILTVVVSFTFSSDEKTIVLTRVALKELDADEDREAEEDSREEIDPFDDDDLD